MPARSHFIYLKNYRHFPPHLFDEIFFSFLLKRGIFPKKVETLKNALELFVKRKFILCFERKINIVLFFYLVTN